MACDHDYQANLHPVPLEASTLKWVGGEGLRVTWVHSQRNLEFSEPGSAGGLEVRIYTKPSS